MLRAHREALPVPEVFTDDELRGVTQPAYVLLASHSEILSATRVAARVHDLMPGSHVEVARDACHSVGYDRPELMSRAIRGFIEGRSPTDGVRPHDGEPAWSRDEQDLGIGDQGDSSEAGA